MSIEPSEAAESEEHMKVYTCFPDGKAKALTMSYDDGKIQDERLIGIFNKYGIKSIGIR